MCRLLVISSFLISLLIILLHNLIISSLTDLLLRWLLPLAMFNLLNLIVLIKHCTIRNCLILVFLLLISLIISLLHNFINLLVIISLTDLLLILLLLVISSSLLLLLLKRLLLEFIPLLF